ncbi:Late competence protein ComEC, DNA transport [Streptococcus sp. DD13]|nr:Late competence protein ComEC, DNA transport [Streptococcus sp. DD13]
MGKNNDSILLYGRFFGTRFLFTGDLEEEGEIKLLQRYPQLQVDVLKLGHHGSKGSSSEAFLDQLKPKIALVSVGLNNRYKHPHEETLQRLTSRGISIYRTDQDGAIRLKGWNQWQLETVHEK